jgi:hypothetical protein
MLAPATTATLTWPIPGDAPDLRAIVEDQAATIEAQAAMIDAYQAVLNAAQNVPGTPATGTGTATGNQLAVSSVTGTIVKGAVITDGVTVPANTTILGQISGTPGGAGNYLTSAVTTAAATPLTFTPPDTTGAWPSLNDAPSLMTILQDQTTILRQQAALIQGYQTLLNDSETPAPPSGP